MAHLNAARSKIIGPITGRAGAEPRSINGNYTAGPVRCIGGLCNATGKLRRDPSCIVADEHELIVAKKEGDFEAKARAK